MDNKYDIIEEQQAVINSFGVNMLVSASAGSGKTTVMIRRIVDLIIKGKAKVNELLVLTYTKAAAAEMKQKLVENIQQNIENNQNLAQQLEEVETSDISTFDSFCQKLVKRYFYAINVVPSFELVQGADEQQLKETALENAVEYYQSKMPDDYAFLYNIYSANRTDKTIKEMAKKLHLAECAILVKDDFIEKCKELFKNDENCLASQIVYDSFIKKINNLRTAFLKLQKESLKYNFVKYVEFINMVLSQIDSILANKNITDLIKYISNFENVNMNKCGKKLQDDIVDIYEKIATNKEILKLTVENFNCFGTENEFKNSLTDCRKVVNCLIELTNIYEQKYSELKERKNLLDYNDIERLVIKLFENQDLRKSIQEQYKFIFVDEYQDANMVQEKIISGLSGKNNLFYVGDLKQAIYGFRNSNPKIFANKQLEYDSNEDSKNFYLNCNFRSNENILQFCNIIFSSLMTKENSDINYKQDACLVPKADYKTENAPNVSLNIIYNPAPEKQQDNAGKIDIYSVKNHILEDGEEKSAKLEAGIVAQKICETMLVDIYDNKKKCYRKPNYSDVTILLRKRGEFQEVFVKELIKLGIPLSVNSNVALEKTYDAKVLMNYIKLSLNWQNDIALTSIMLSELYNFSCDDLSVIRSFSPDEKFFYQAVINYLQNNDEISQKIATVIDGLKKFKYDASYRGLNYALNDMIVDTKYLIKIREDESGEIRYNNVTNFINSFEGSIYEFDICAYINFIQTSEREQKVFNAPKDNNSVNITTMHSSKGLEYPIVFICNLSDDFSKNMDKVEMEINENYGIGVKYYDKISRTKFSSVFYEAIKQKNKSDDFSEKLRLLYVAFTRAKNRLFLIGTTKKLAFLKLENEYEISRQNNYLNLIIGALDNCDIEKINNGTVAFKLNCSDRFEYNLIDVPKAENNQTIKIYNEKCDAGESEKLLNYMTAPYFNDEATKIAQKNSVSSILKSENEQNGSLCFAPKQLLLKEHLSDDINEVGSFYHKVLELIDFNKNIECQIGNVISIIKNKKLFKEEIVSQLNINIIKKCVLYLQDLTKGKTLLKEQKFIMQVPYNTIENSCVTDKVLIQGICDLIVINGNKITIIDYKFSSLSADKLIEKYKKQLELYKIAISYAMQKEVEKMYILSIKTANLIEVS